MTQSRRPSRPQVRCRSFCLGSIFCFLLSLYAHGADQMATVHFFGKEVGFDQGLIRQMVEDETGFLWAITSNTICRFDGSQVLGYGEDEPLLKDSELLGLMAVPQSGLWFELLSPQGKRLVFLNPETGQFQSFDSLYPGAAGLSGRMYGLHPLPRGQGFILVTQAGEIFHVGAEEVKLIFKGVQPNPLNASVTEAGTILFFADDQILEMTKDGEILRQADKPFPWSSVFIGESEKGALRFFLPDGPRIGEYSFVDSTVNVLAEDEIFPFAKAGEPVSQMFMNRHSGRLWSFVDDDVIWVSEPGGSLYIRLQEEVSAQDLAFSQVYFPGPSEAWISTLGGIYHIQLRANPFRQLATASQTGKKSSMRGMTRNLDGTLLLQSNLGLWLGNPDQEALRLLEVDEFPDSPIKQYLPRGGISAYSDRLGRDLVDLVGIRMVREGSSWKYEGEEVLFTTCMLEHPEDPVARIWMGSNSGLYTYDLFNQQYQLFQGRGRAGEELLKVKTLGMVAGPGGHLWLCTNGGLFRLAVQTGELAHWGPEDKAEKLPDYRISHLAIESDSVFWLSTLGGGLIRWNPGLGHTEVYRQVDGLGSDVVYAVYQDDGGNLWLPTQNGLTFFDPRSGTFRTFFREDGLPENEFNTYSHFRDREGYLYFGGLNGAVMFHPDSLRSTWSQDTVQLQLTHAAYFDVSLEQMVRCDTRIGQEKVLQVPPGTSFISVRVASLDYGRSPGIIYRIPELDNTWRFQAQPEIQLHGLRAQSYTLEVKPAFMAGEETAQPFLLKVQVQSYFYETVAFWVGLCLIGVLLLYLTLRWRWRRQMAEQRRLEKAVEEGVQEIRKRAEELDLIAAELREVDRQKSVFFANVSHEIRTPLTLILAPLQKVLQVMDSKAKGRANLQIALSNAEKLQKQIGQLMVLASFETGKFRSEPVRFVLFQFLENLARDFGTLAAQQLIAFVADLQIPSDWEVELDPDHLETILGNLLGNAFKFTPQGGEVHFRVAVEGDQLRFTVGDTGPGVPASEAARIFERYYQSAGGKSVQAGGFGIGLSLALELAKQMKGNLRLDPKQSPGATFILSLPLEQPVSAVEIFPAKPVLWLAPEPGSPPLQVAPPTGEYLLIVEDHPTMRSFLVQELSPYYPVFAVANGGLALDLIRETPPILVVSDLMMPVMDGMTLLTEVRHFSPDLPFILLTALTGGEYQIQALQIGIDDYMTKPFTVEELQLRIQRCLKNRSARLEAQEEEVEDGPAMVDQSWLLQVETIVQHDLSGISPDRLADALSMNLRTLQRRLKRISGLSPAAFIREVKLQTARTHLEARTYETIKEVAAASGFPSTSSFSQSFKNAFGKTPSAFLQL